MKKATLYCWKNEKDKEERRVPRGNRGDRREGYGREERRGTRSDRDVRSDLVGESNLAK